MTLCCFNLFLIPNAFTVVNNTMQVISKDTSKLLIVIPRLKFFLFCFSDMKEDRR